MIQFINVNARYLIPDTSMNSFIYLFFFFRHKHENIHIDVRITAHFCIHEIKVNGKCSYRIHDTTTTLIKAKPKIDKVDLLFILLLFICRLNLYTCIFVHGVSYKYTIKIIIDRLLLLFGLILNECTNVMQKSE